MTTLTLQGIGKRFGDTAVLSRANLHVGSGEFVVFVGPSGSGKSTLLRIIAGLEDPSEGEVLIGGEVATGVPASRRGIAMVFQSYALYPHMNVRDNMAFALRMGGCARGEIARRVQRSADILKIGHLLDRKPRTLSGGQRQRVAIGRAIVREPRVFLFDEPLSNLDAALRQDMRVELAKLHRELGATMVYVTHDQVEAMTLADRIVVFDHGSVQQVGTPAELYDAPANLFVAGFLGASKMNLLDVQPGEGGVRIAGHGPLPAGAATEGAATLGIRPEHVQVGSHPAANSLPATVELVEYLGDHRLVYLRVAGVAPALCAKLADASGSWKAGVAVHAALPARHCHLFDATGRALARTDATTSPR